jgi:hypothetical protein
MRWCPLIKIETPPRIYQKILKKVVLRVIQIKSLLAIAGVKKVEEKLKKMLIFT